MPLSRYSIRNEYSLADPELYRAADKDDPEALLEGVAMAGLVGVLRQLGDLAEFAAEIFHDLHEDLMATAARGHGLTVRVQQIEAEFPSIEKAFLSQARHSSFFYNTGIDWHPNVHMDQNLVTQGDLPRFVMDSYEECRGPPRLFLLDKFDVAGAGSCLKRYTDPSFFKGESPLSAMPSAEVQREKKSRKSKKKGSRRRNAETPEVLSTSHVKLQQLLLEERVENNISDPARRVKLKRRLNGSPFDSGMGKSYMDAILKIPTPDPDVVREISITSSPLKFLASVAGETGNEVLDVPAISPGKKTQQRKRNTFSSSDSEAGNKPFIHALTEEYSGMSPNFASTQMDNVHSTPHEVDKREIVAEEVRKLDGYQSDDEVDNYVDALATMDSEMETDSEYRAQKDTRFFNVNGRQMGSDATEELSDIQTHSTDCQSIKSSSLMDGGNSSSRKGKSSFSYSGSFDLAENAQSEKDDSARTTISGEHRETEIVNSSSDRYSFNENTPSTQTPRHIIQDNACNENANISSYKSEVGESSSSSCLIESGTVLLPGDPGEHFMEFSSLGPEVDEISSNHSNSKAGCVENEKNSIHIDKNIPWTSNYNDRPFRTEDAGFSNLSSNSMDGLNDQDKHKSYTFLHLPSVLQLASNNNSNEDLTNDIMRGEFLEKEHAFTSVASPVQSAVTLSSQKEEFAKRKHETCSPCANPEGNNSEETASRCSLTLDCLETADLVEMPLQRSENGRSLDPGVCFSHDRELKIDGLSSSKVDGEEMNGLSFDNDLVQKDNDYSSSVSDIRSFPDSPHAVDVSLDDGIKGAIHLQAKDVATAVADTNLINNESDATSLDTRSMKLRGKCSLFFQDLRQNGMKFGEEYIHESSMEEMVNEQAYVSSELESFSSKTLPCDDHSDLDLLHCVFDSFSGENSRNISHVNKGSAGMPSYQNTEDAEAKSLQKINVIDKEEDAQRSPTRHLAEMSISQGLQVKLCNGQFDAQSSHDQVSESDSSQHTVFVEDTENVLSLPTDHLAEVSTPLDQKVESHNGNLDVISCHVTHDQVPESKHVHQTEALEEEEGISSPTHRVAELRIPVQDNFELHNNQFDLESRYDQVSQLTLPQHTDFIENAENSISSPTHHKAELTASQQQTDESLRVTFYTEPCQRQDSESFEHLNTCGKADDSVSPFTHDTTELKPCMEQKVEFQNDQLDVKSWHDQSFELDHAEHIKVTESSETDVYTDTHFIDSSETAVSSDSHFNTELICPIDLTRELEDHFDEKSRHTNNASVDPLSQIRQAESSIPNFQDRESCPSFEISAVHLSSQPPLPHFLPQFSVSKPAEDPLRSNFPTFGLLPEASLDEMPPLPPLPPMQWRLGKVPQTFPAPEGNMLGHNLHSVPPLMSAPNDKSQSCHPETDAGSSYPSNPFSRHSFSEHHDSQDMNVNQADFVVHSADPVSRQVPDLVTIASRVLVTTPGLVLPMDHSVKREDVLLDSERGKIHHDMNPFSPPTTVEDTPSTLPSCSVSEKTVEPLSQSAPSTSSKLEDSIQEEAILSEEKTMPTTGISLPVIHVFEKQPILSTSEEEATWTSSSSLSLAPSKDGMPNGNEKIKLPRPRNPLIDAVVAHDKSKLRKVTQLPQPQIGQKAEERDSLLEQIRAKSFNLKPAVVTRPSIQGPKTNLRLAAILEKANAIRQAFAGTGSDEDDDDDAWSDS